MKIESYKKQFRLEPNEEKNLIHAIDIYTAQHYACQHLQYFGSNS